MKLVFQGLQKLLLSLLLWLGICGFAQQTPIRITPVMTPPYPILFPQIAQTSQEKILLHILMADLNEPHHEFNLKFKLLGANASQPIAQSTHFIEGMRNFSITPGQNLTLSNLDFQPLFQKQNLTGFSPQNYAKPLPQGLYQFCFQASDVFTKRELSNWACTSVYLQLYDPPLLALPKNAEIISPKNQIQNIFFQWIPRQFAPNSKYIFTLKEIGDNQRDPIAAFLTARTLWQEETFAPNLFYGIDKTPLIPGKRYAWQVRAVSANPSLYFSFDPNDASASYQNNGFSEIFFFDYHQNCNSPNFIFAQNQGRGKTQIFWNFQDYSPDKHFIIQYRKKDANKDWNETFSYNNSVIISKLEDDSFYEYRVGAKCGTAQFQTAFAFSDIQSFKTDSKEKASKNYQCGFLPNIDLRNKDPFTGALGANDSFYAGDFPVTVISAEGNNGYYSGEGFIKVPYLADTKIKVFFNNIFINSQKQLIRGTVETEYDPVEKNVMSIEELLSELSELLKKENPSQEDEKKYLEWKQKWLQEIEFYLSDIDDIIEMPEDDKRKFEQIKGNMFYASLNKMTDKDRENASKATNEAQKLYKKYEKEFKVLQERNNLTQNNVKHIDFEKLKKAKNLLYFVNGHYSFAPVLGPTNGRKDYWLYFDNNKRTHVSNFLTYFGFNPKETLIIYVDGSSKIGGDQDFKDRFKIGEKFIKLALEKDINLTKKASAIVAHSEGVAYSAGMIEELYKNKAKIKEAVYLSADEGAEAGAYTNPNVPTYQIEYAYFDTDRDKGCIAHYDWVIGTHRRYKNYTGIKGVTKFGIGINNKLNATNVHGASADPDIIDFLNILKTVKYSQNLNSEGKLYHNQIPRKNILFWKINDQFIDANHPQFDMKKGKINYNLKCKK